MNKRLSKYAHSHEQYTVTELDSKDFSSRTTNKDGRVVWLVVDPPPYAGMLMSHAPSCGSGFALFTCYYLVDPIFNTEPAFVCTGSSDKHWRRSVISMLCAGESQIVFLPHHRCVSACCSLTRVSLFIPTDSSSTSDGVITL